MIGFKGEDAYLYGTKEAIVINYFRYWIGKNKANEKHFYDERYWTYNSVRALTEIFYYWSEKQIRRTLDSLVNKGVLIKGNYNKTAYDRTNWYAFVNEEHFLNEHIHLPKKTNSISQNGEMTFPQKGEPIPINIPINNTVNNTINSEEEIFPWETEKVVPIKEVVKKKTTKKTKTEKEFIPPTLEQVRDYCVNVRKNNVDYKRFYDYYEANDWKDGTNRPIVNWKQKLVAWWEPKAKEYDKSKPAQQSLEDNRKAFKDMTEAEKVEYWRKIDAEIAERNNRRG